MIGRCAAVAEEGELADARPGSGGPHEEGTD
jgi:hypothetical protein